MSADLPGDFVDSNLLVYAHSRASGQKRERAAALLDRLWDTGTGRLSMQVLQEYFVTVTRKVPRPLSIAEALEVVELYSRWTVHCPEPADLLSAIDIHKRLEVSFWDAMVIQSARRLGCRILWSEDLHHGQTYSGVSVRDPFLDMVMDEGENTYGPAQARAREDSKTRDKLHQRRRKKQG
jgi:predicted nucleic acid-binding protein